MESAKVCRFCERGAGQDSKQVTVYAAAKVSGRHTGFKEYTNTYHDLKPLTLQVCQRCQWRLQLKKFIVPGLAMLVPFIFVAADGGPRFGWNPREVISLLGLGLLIALIVMVAKAEVILDADYVYAKELVRRHAGPGFLTKAMMERMKRTGSL